ncbi:MAG: hypothetical protein MUF87_16800 [Anaerolineae bacterium]|jgi:hypothetical protein|nr:hypothetical protein [Anaerolineae bacterium]
MWMKKLPYLVFSLLIIVLCSHLLYNSSIEGQSTTENSLQTVLLEYQQSLASASETNRPPSLVIRLITPLEANGDPFIFLGDGSDNPFIQIASVGADHVCFEVTRNENRSVSCIPFTNITVIRELF